MSDASETPGLVTHARLGSIDAYRGLVMFLMMAEVLELGQMARNFPDNRVWQFLGQQQTHVEWTGCTLHDMIQPSFSFLVGVALPFSIASRRRAGASTLALMGHAAWRALLLTLLGVFLRSVGRPHTNWTFEDTLSQIGLGYLPLFLLGLAPIFIRWGALVLIVVGYWLAFAAYSPPTEVDLASLGIPPDWAYNASGLAAKFNKNVNLGAAFDQWFLNLFPRDTPFVANRGGYLTLSFIPTLGTMILGLIAGGWLQDRSFKHIARILRLVAAGIVFTALGWWVGQLGLCPVVKRIWTPSWTLFSGGICFLMLCAFYVTIDVPRWQGWSYPLRVIGANSIFAYVMAHLLPSFIVSSIHTHFGSNAFARWGTNYEPFVQGIVVLVIEWLILAWMYRNRVFIKI